MRLGVVGRLGFLLALSAAGTVSAQGTDNPVEALGDDKSVIEEVLVTGSRVRRSNLDAPSPVIVIDAQALEDGGFTTLGEFARYLPQNAETFSDSWSANTEFLGSAAFNLRGVGLDGTLTLVNGRRIAPYGGSDASGPFVDINAIPVAAIERIEVLKDGASAIYGSEAVAGVVNIILKSGVETITVDAGYQTTDEGDGTEMQASITGGADLGATEFTGTLSWFDRELIWARDREFSSELDFSNRGGGNGRSFQSSPPTVLVPSLQTLVADPACPELSPIVSRWEGIGNNGLEAEHCRFNWTAFSTIQQPSERWAGTALLTHAFDGGMEAFAEAIYSRNETRSVLAPTPVRNATVPAHHPDNPFGETVRIHYRVLDAGDRGNIITNSNWRALAGLRGQWASGWDWETAITRSEAESASERYNAVLVQAFRAALSGRGGPNGDQYYNPFGLNPQNAREVLDQFLISGTEISLTNAETSLDGQVSGSLWDLPHGELGSAFGVQWRQLDVDQYADPEELTGEIEGGGGILAINEKRAVGSAFAEFVVPVLASLEAQLAVRYDDYDDAGDTTNPKIGLGWRPRGDLLLRATWGTSFRPPTFRELHNPPFEVVDSSGTDPWRCPVTGSAADCFGAEITYFQQGNPDLKPDEGETMLVGIAWEPESVDGLFLTLDLWEIEHVNRILDSERLMGELMEKVAPEDNPLVIRAPASPQDQALGIPGPITAIYYTYVNAGKVDVRGLDFSIGHRWSVESGDWSGQLDYTRQDEYLVGLSQYGVEVLQDWAGGYGETSGMPKDRASMGFGWQLAGHGANANVYYTGGYNSWMNLWVDGQETDQPFAIDEYWQLDLQYQYEFTGLRGATMRLGCQNCSGNDPPTYNAGTSAEPFHEGRGVILYARWSQPF